MEHTEAWREQIIYLGEKITHRETLASKLGVSLDLVKILIEAATQELNYNPRLLTIQSIDRVYKEDGGE